MSAAAHSHPGFRHEALLYADEREFIEGTLPFLREGVALGEAALVVVAPERIATLRDGLGEDERHVHFADMRQVGVNPARIIPAWYDFFDLAGGDRPLRGIGEPIWAGRTPAELVECQRHESLLNLAFADAPAFRLLCPYDTTALDPAVVAEARRTHPLVSDGKQTRTSRCFHGLAAAATPWTAPLSPVPAGADELPFDAGALAIVRATITRHAVRARLAPTRIEDLVLAVNELATNSIRHGGGSGTLHIWQDDDALICEVRDAGALDRPLAGRRRPATGQIGQYGLWLVNQLCDLVEQRTLPGGNAVRVRMRLAA